MGSLHVQLRNSGTSSQIETLSLIEELTLEMSKAKASVSCIIPSIGVLKILFRSEHSRSVAGRNNFSRLKGPNVWGWQHCWVLDARIMPLEKRTHFKPKQWLKEEKAIASESEQQVTTGDQGSGREKRNLRSC